MVKVSLARCENYASAEKGVRHAIKLAGGVPRKKTAFIKVNLLSASPPGDGITTHPAVVKAAVLELQKKCEKIFVGDAPGFASLEKAAKKSGIAEACEESGAELAELGEIREYQNPRATLAKRSALFSGAFDYGLLVNLPKLKTHALTLYTGAVKNLFGFVPATQRRFYHLKYPDPVSFSRMLLDNYLLIRPGFNIMDGIVGMEGNGPSAGTLRNFNLIAASRDALALDTACAHLLGIGKKVPILNIARKTGLENAFLENVQLAGDRTEPIHDLALPESSIFQIPAPFLKIARGHLSAKPYALKKKCTGCGTCANVCPAEAIRMEGAAKARIADASFLQKIPVFDYKKCVRCYTCQEMCPSKAIGLEENPIVRAGKECARKIRGY